ncbi:hypothetical protein HAN_1g69 (nucleomorph) [Hemiselmis andersenii]|uniref:Taf13 n=1 Tax=Hemiselmis andersenii TaxID=464988 RepID=A9BK81_HEMAN|nr:hypothetical protein HAN_1g69 [Hemiselmis andersenii]ABW97914.1 hypothetical protein HAN_1g69 [Hemiselmis andersenii]
MESQNIYNNIIKYLEMLFIQLEIKTSKQLKRLVSQYCMEYLENIFFLLGIFCEKISKTTLSEEDFLFIIEKLQLKRYKGEICEEKKRTQTENFCFEKFYS